MARSQSQAPSGQGSEAPSWTIGVRHKSYFSACRRRYSSRGLYGYIRLHGPTRSGSPITMYFRPTSKFVGYSDISRGIAVRTIVLRPLAPLNDSSTWISAVRSERRLKTSACTMSFDSRIEVAVRGCWVSSFRISTGPTQDVAAAGHDAATKADATAGRITTAARAF